MVTESNRFVSLNDTEYLGTPQRLRNSKPTLSGHKFDPDIDGTDKEAALKQSVLMPGHPLLTLLLHCPITLEKYKKIKRLLCYAN